LAGLDTGNTASDAGGAMRAFVLVTPGLATSEGAAAEAFVFTATGIGVDESDGAPDAAPACACGVRDHRRTHVHARTWCRLRRRLAAASVGQQLGLGIETVNVDGGERSQLDER
jgi:hypothetical protein